MRQHRNEAAYPALWAAVDGAIRDACAMHADIEIPDRRRASIVKRCVGQVLALEARAARAAETAGTEVVGSGDGDGVTVQASRHGGGAVSQQPPLLAFAP